MQTAIAVLSAWLLPLAGPDKKPPPDPRALLRKAVEAHGGAARLKRLRVVREQTEGVLTLKDQKIPYLVETVQRLPGQFRITTRSEVAGKLLVVVQVFDGRRGWLQEGGIARPADAGALASWKELAHAAEVATLTPLLAAEKGYGLTLLPEVKVLGRAAAGVKVTHAGRRDVALYFDCATGLLVQKVCHPHAGAKSSQTEIYSDFKDLDGLKRPTCVQILINGVPHAEAIIKSTEFPERLDDKEFTRP
jgi:hypothetical protein